MRLTFWALLALASLCFVLAATTASRGSRTDPRTVTTSGTVRELLDGPYHALVEVRPANGPAFTFPANTQAGLRPGQTITVRYLPDQPRETAEAVTGEAGNSVWPLLMVGLVLMAAALFSPLLVRLFPGVLAFRVRP